MDKKTYIPKYIKFMAEDTFAPLIWDDEADSLRENYNTFKLP